MSLIASDLSYEVLQRRRRRFELQTPPLDSTNQALVAIPSAVIQREGYAADREAIRDSYQGGFSYATPFIGKQQR